MIEKFVFFIINLFTGVLERAVLLMGYQWSMHSSFTHSVYVKKQVRIVRPLCIQSVKPMHAVVGECALVLTITYTRTILCFS